jgi:hypothetical protein
MRAIIILSIVLSQLNVYSTDIMGFTTKANAFLVRYVSNGLVDYGAIKKDPSDADNLYQQIGNMNLDNTDATTRKAFYINAYNIVVIYAVVRAMPIKSPMEVPGFFDGLKHRVAGEDLTLNELENKKLRQAYKDGRIHFALACAAQSCPPLASFAYTGERIEDQLRERTALTLNKKEWIRLHPAQKKVEVSKIFEWYKEDFISAGNPPLGWINQFRKEKIPLSFAVGFYEYNWTLNRK